MRLPFGGSYAAIAIAIHRRMPFGNRRHEFFAGDDLITIGVQSGDHTASAPWACTMAAATTAHMSGAFAFTALRHAFAHARCAGIRSLIPFGTGHAAIAIAVEPLKHLGATLGADLIPIGLI
jgi:hypothetical protein